MPTQQAAVLTGLASRGGACSRNNAIHGGTGNDRMQAGFGNDTYYIDPKDGDRVLDDAHLGSVSDIVYGIDTLIAPDGIALSHLLFSREGNDLTIGNTRIERYFETSGWNPSPPVSGPVSLPGRTPARQRARGGVGD